MSKITLFYNLFREALSAKHLDLTAISINRAIFFLAVPMILEMVMEALFAVVDVFYVSKLGIDMVATVGLTESVMSLVYSMAIGLSMAATAMVARRVGEKRIKDAAKAAMQAIYIGVGLAMIISVVGLLFSESILEMMGASEKIVSEGAIYMKWMLGGNIVIMLIFLINGIFRGAGDARIAMRTLWLSNGLNIILDPILIFGLGPFPELGIAGAAIATNIGRGVGVLYQLYHLFGGNSVLKIMKEQFRVNWTIIKRLMNVSLGGTGQFLISSASWIFLMRIISMFESEALAGYTIAIRIVIFTILPAWGLSNAAATLVGQNLGAQKPDRAEKSVWKAAFINMIFLGIIAVFFFFTSEALITIFTDDKLAIEYGSQCLQIICFGYMAFAYGMVINQAFNGAGDTRTPTILNFIGFWIVQIPLAYYLAITIELGPKGVFMAIAIAQTLLAVMCIFVFRQGKWKSTKI
ncbi:MAG: MATE family efflux transporter [Bacteroidetes bacterium]|nr:MAG: MATE family efflux transporter [Bacteroidota bacterium]